MMINELSSRWPAITATAIILSTAWVVHKFLQPNPLAKIPFLGSGQKDFMNGGGWKVYAEGYKKVRNRFTINCYNAGLPVTVQRRHLPNHDF